MGGESLVLACALFSGGIGLACAVVPPAHPPTFLETGGLPLYPRRGLCAPAPRFGDGGSERRRSQFLIGAARRTSELAPDGVIDWFEPSQVGLSGR